MLTMSLNVFLFFFSRRISAHNKEIVSKDKNAILQEYDIVMDDLNIPTTSVAKNIPIETKIKLIHWHKENKIQMGRLSMMPEFFIEKLRSSKMDFLLFQSLRISLSNQPISWLKSFYTLHGLDILLYHLQQMIPEPDKSVLLHEILQALRSFMNNKFGFVKSIEHKHLIATISQSINERDLLTSKVSIELLAVIMSYKKDITETILTSFEHKMQGKVQESRFAWLKTILDRSIEELKIKKSIASVGVIESCLMFLKALFESLNNPSFCSYIYSQVLISGIIDTLNDLQNAQHEKIRLLSISVKSRIDTSLETLGQQYKLKTLNLIKNPLKTYNELIDEISNKNYGLQLFNILHLISFVPKELNIREEVYKKIEREIEKVVVGDNKIDREETPSPKQQGIPSLPINSVPPKPPSLPPKRKKPAVKFALSLSNLDHDRLKKTVWNCNESPPLGHHLKELELLYKKDPKSKRATNAYICREKKIETIDFKKKRSLEIVLSSFKFTADDIFRAINDLDETVINEIILENILKNLPNDVEKSRLMLVDDLSQLTNPELLMYKIIYLPDYERVLEFVHFKTIFTETITYLNTIMKLYQKLSANLIQNNYIKKVFCIVLIMSNKINEISLTMANSKSSFKKFNSFSSSELQKIISFKLENGNRLMDFIAFFIYRTFTSTELDGLFCDYWLLKKCLEYNLDSLNEVKVLVTKFHDIKVCLEINHQFSMLSNNFLSKMRNFIESSSFSVEDLNLNHKLTYDAIEHAKTYFNEDGAVSNMNFFQNLLEFFLQLEKSITSIQKKGDNVGSFSEIFLPTPKHDRGIIDHLVSNLKSTR